jgi:hypothetical protein
VFFGLVERVAGLGWSRIWSAWDAFSACLPGLAVAATGELVRRGALADRGYRPAQAVADLLGWDVGEAKRRVGAAEQV